MNPNAKMIAAARRAARHLSRADGNSYQLCLDLVARQAGRQTWAAFLADPVPVDDSAARAAAEPDFTKIVPTAHLTAIVQYSRILGAGSFYAGPRAWDNAEPVLKFNLEDEKSWPIDARGLSLQDLAIDALPNFPSKAFKSQNSDDSSLTDDMPTIDGALMRTIVRQNWASHPNLISVSGTVDGTTPRDIHLPSRPRETPPVIGSLPRSYWRRHNNLSVGQAIKRLVQGHAEYNLATLVEKNALSTSVGPIIGISERGKSYRLQPGTSIMAFSPPGTGRMVGISIPALLTDDTSSYVVHDDGQLYARTAGWRATLGRVALIRLDGHSPDAINPFGRGWLPEPKYIKRYIDILGNSIMPDDQPAARLIAETASNLIEVAGETTLRDICQTIAAKRTNDVAERVAASLTPLTDELGHAATGHSSINFGMIRSKHDHLLTIYIERDPTSSGTRDRLASLIQTAIIANALSDGRASHPRPVTTIYHDMHRMPKIPELCVALDLARYVGMSIIMTGASAAVVRERYGSHADLITKLTTMQMMLQQSDAREAKLVDVYNEVSPTTLAGVEQGHFLLTNRMRMRPIKMRLPVYFEDPAMKARSLLSVPEYAS